MKKIVLAACAASLLMLLPISTHAQWNPLNPVTDVQKRADGVQFTLKSGTMKLQVCSAAIIRVLYSPTASFPARTDYVVIKNSGRRRNGRCSRATIPSPSPPRSSRSPYYAKTAA